MGVVPCDRSLNWVTAVAGVPEKNKPARGEGLVVVLPAAKKRKPGFGSQAADWESFGFESKGQQPSEAKPLTAKVVLLKPEDSKTADEGGLRRPDLPECNSLFPSQTINPH